MRAHQLGRYHLLDRIAFGGMAEIYRARTFDAEGRPHMVAIKKVLAHLLEDEDFLQMLVDEAKIAALLHHENIAQVYEFARSGDEYFIAMEYVDGKDMRTTMERCRQTGRKLPIEMCAFVAMKALRGLHAAHTRRDGTGADLSIVHRDVSPSNVLVSYGGEVKLIDFGIAKATLSRVQTKTGVIKGKVKYMSPEQALGRKLDARSDLFSVAAVLYEMLTLQPPFSAANEMQLIFRVRDAKVRPVTELRADVPETLRATVHRGLSRSRSARFQSGAEFADSLEGFLAGLGLDPELLAADCGRFLRDAFASDIDRELRSLEEFVVTEADPSAVGESLIELPPDSAYTQFSPMPPAGAQDATGAPTRHMPRVPSPEERLPPATDLHAAPTQILAPDDPRRMRPAPQSNRAPMAPTIDQPPPASPPTKRPRRPLPMSEEFHSAPTQIIRPRRR